MSLSNTREAFGQPGQRDEVNDQKRAGFQKYVSPWVHIDGSDSHDFVHGLGGIPHVTSVLTATDSQGSNQAEASSLIVQNGVTVITVANSGAARFFRVRAF